MGRHVRPVRERLGEFKGIAPRDPARAFHGELRPYQREGLGWLDFLREFGFGGSLADDMGLGKTIQVLALLQSRRRGSAGDRGPSLVVVPRSLVFNWIQEAARFTPRLRVLDYTGPDRATRCARRSTSATWSSRPTARCGSDIAELADIEFDYVILDEAQAIKNADSQAAKAARLLRARHRLAISGTPIENHLGELWSIFEFLNPGMLGAAAVFRRNAAAPQPPPTARRAPSWPRRCGRSSSGAPRPQVVQDLPEKTEQTLYCDMEPEQRKLYDELREHYRHVAARADRAPSGIASRRSRCSKRCCGSARPPATPA